MESVAAASGSMDGADGASGEQKEAVRIVTGEKEAKELLQKWISGGEETGAAQWIGVYPVYDRNGGENALLGTALSCRREKIFLPAAGEKEALSAKALIRYLTELRRTALNGKSGLRCLI